MRPNRSMHESDTGYMAYLVLSREWRADSDDHLHAMQFHVLVMMNASAPC